MSGDGRDDDDRDADVPGEDESGLVGVDASPRAPLTREQVEAVRRENEELRDQLLRRRADFDNYRKRV
ncbi:MAG TPA: nucleotide exchange factor GrpE, partial [Vicinamibacteria bacterium]